VRTGNSGTDDFPDPEKVSLRAVAGNLSIEDAERIKEIEKVTTMT